MAEKNAVLDAKISAESGTTYKPAAKKTLKKVAVAAKTKKLKAKEDAGSAGNPVELPAENLSFTVCRRSLFRYLVADLVATEG